MTVSSSLRIGDAERDTAAEWLRQHFVDGRLTEREYEERLDATFAARTAGELARLFADLPRLDRGGRRERARARHLRWPLVPAALVVGFLGLLSLARVHSSVAYAHPNGPFAGPAGGVVSEHSVPVGPVLLVAVVAVAALLTLAWVLHGRGRRRAG